MDFIIEEIQAKTTHVIRHAVLRKGQPIESCVFEGDEKTSSIHLGVFTNRKLIGVLSAYERKHTNLKESLAYQVRGVAVLEAFRGHGVGWLLMRRIEDILSEKGIPVIWLNARILAVPFYEKLDYAILGEPFDIPLIGQHYFYYKHLQ